MVSVTMFVQEILVSGEDTPTARKVEWARMWCEMHGGEWRKGKESDAHPANGKAKRAAWDAVSKRAVVDGDGET